MANLLNTNKTCNVCHYEKSISGFRKRKKELGGGYYAICKECHKKMRDAKLNRKATNNAPAVDLTQPLDLNFLLDLNGWTAEEIKALLLTVKQYTSSPYRMKPRSIYQRYFPNRTTIQCARILMEFKEVAAHGIKFDDYMKGDRKYRKDGRRILAKPGK